MTETNTFTEFDSWRAGVGCAVLALSLVASIIPVPATWAADPFGTERSPKIPIAEPTDIALDQVNWKRPQGVFTWIAMAKGYQTPWDSHGRQGWLTDDAYVEPVEPGVSTFTQETEEIYIVFEGQPLDAPGQFAAAWHPMIDGAAVGGEPLGKDVIELEMNQRYGYFIITPPDEIWTRGDYLVKIYYGSPGQNLHAINVVGTMTFTITE